MGFSSALRVICARLKMVYGISLDIDPMAFVIDRDLLHHFSSDSASLDPAMSQVLVQHSEESDGERHCDLALYFPAGVKNQLDIEDPLASLSLTNLDSLWQVIEELSHFLLLASRSVKDLSTTSLELEWQGEIDKVLIAAMMLADQNGKSQALDLSTLLHHHCRIISADPVYREAQFFAQKFWYHHRNALDNQLSPASNRELMARLRALYAMNWPEKLRAIA